MTVSHASFGKSWVSFLAKDAVFLMFCLPVVLGLALLVNSLRASPLPLIREAEDLRMARSATNAEPAAMAGPLAILDLEGAATAQAEGGDTWVDAREEAFYSLGHVTGARNLPRKGFEKQFAAFAREVPRERSLIVYCSGPDCEGGMIVARALARLGYSRVRVFRGGWEEWQASGLPTEP